MTAPRDPATAQGRVADRPRCDTLCAARFANWIAHGGGVAVWRAVGSPDPPAAFYTPLFSYDGVRFGPPIADVGDRPAEVITDPARIDVVTDREFERFTVGVRYGAQRLSLKIDEEGTRRIAAALANAVRQGHADPVHQFDYQTHEVTILVPERVEPLSTFFTPGI